MGFATLLFYIITLLVTTVVATIENKNKVKVSALEGKSYEICIIGCIITSIILAIWLNTLGDDSSGVGIYTYYINGVRVNSGSMFVTESIFIAFIFFAVGSMLTSLIAHIPAFICADRLRAKSNIALERKKKIAVLLCFSMTFFNIHLVYLGLSGLFFIRIAILAVATVSPVFGMVYISSPLLIISAIWWLFDIVYILKCKDKFYTSHIHWMKR